MEGLLAILIIPIIVNAIISAVVAAIIIKTKGGDDKEVNIFFLYGFFLGIIAIVHAIVRHRTLEEERKRHTLAGRVACRLCDEYISPKAVVCPFCQRDIEQDETPDAQPESASEIGDETQSAPAADNERNIKQGETPAVQPAIASEIGDKTQSTLITDDERNNEQGDSQTEQPASASGVGDKTQSTPTADNDETNGDSSNKIILTASVVITIILSLLALWRLASN